MERRCTEAALETGHTLEEWGMMGAKKKKSTRRASTTAIMPDKWRAQKESSCPEKCMLPETLIQDRAV